MNISDNFCRTILLVHLLLCGPVCVNGGSSDCPCDKECGQLICCILTGCYEGDEGTACCYYELLCCICENGGSCLKCTAEIVCCTERGKKRCNDAGECIKENCTKCTDGIKHDCRKCRKGCRDCCCPEDCCCCSCKGCAKECGESCSKLLESCRPECGDWHCWQGFKTKWQSFWKYVCCIPSVEVTENDQETPLQRLHKWIGDIRKERSERIGYVPLESLLADVMTKYAGEQDGATKSWLDGATEKWTNTLSKFTKEKILDIVKDVDKEVKDSENRLRDWIQSVRDGVKTKFSKGSHYTKREVVLFLIDALKETPQKLTEIKKIVQDVGEHQVLKIVDEEFPKVDRATITQWLQPRRSRRRRKGKASRGKEQKPEQKQLERDSSESDDTVEHSKKVPIDDAMMVDL